MLAEKSPHLAKKRPHLAQKRPHLAFLLILSLLWQVLSQEGECTGGVGPSQEVRPVRDHRGYAGGGTGAGLGGGG